MNGDEQEAGPSFSEVCLLWLPCLYCPGTPHSTLLSQPRAGHQLGLGCWNGASRPGSRHIVKRDSIQSRLPWRGAGAYRPKAVLEIFRLGLQRKRKRRGKWLLNNRA